MTTTRPDSGTAQRMSDVFIVTIAAQSGPRNAGIVLAADLLDAYAAHHEQYPDDEIVKITQCEQYPPGVKTLI
jgi:hypothetical protein